MRTFIKGGTVVTSEGAAPSDVLIGDERIVAVLAPDSDAARSLGAGADRVLEVAGKYVIPGGIDAHTHMEMPFGGTTSADTFETGTRAAAWGGTTTIIDFAIQAKGGSLCSAVDEWHAKADGVCAVDYAFHCIISDGNETTLKEMDSLVEQGVTSFKLFMAYPGVFYANDGDILRTMRTAARNGALVMMHAENGIAIDAIVEAAVAKGQSEPIFHGLTRPSELEGEATHRAIVLAGVAGAPVYIVHVSCSEALAAIVEATRSRTEGTRRDVPPVPLPLRGRPCPTGLRGGEVRVHSPTAARPSPGGALERSAQRRLVRRRHGPLPVPLRGAKGPWRGRLHEDPERPSEPREPDGPRLPGGCLR